MTQRRGDGDAQHEPSVQRDDCWNTGTYPEQDVKTGNEHSCYLLIETLKHRKHDDKKKNQVVVKGKRKHLVMPHNFSPWVNNSI